VEQQQQGKGRGRASKQTCELLDLSYPGSGGWWDTWEHPLTAKVQG
jgi:hypothetical protein